MADVTVPDTGVKTIRSDDPNFFINAGLYFSPRASFEITKDCPSEYRDMINRAYLRGWFRPIAVMKTSEYIWEKLSE